MKETKGKETERQRQIRKRILKNSNGEERERASTF